MAKPPKVEPFPLAQAKEDMTVIVERITEEAEADKKLLEHLWRNDVRPGRRLKIIEVAPWAGTITASGDGQTIALGLPAAREDLGLHPGRGRMKALFWVFVAILCVYIFYIGAMGIWSYLEVTSIVEDVVNERASRSGRDERATRIRDEIAKKVTDSGIRTDDRGVTVSDTGPALDVGVRWKLARRQLSGRSLFLGPAQARAHLQHPRPLAACDHAAHAERPTTAAAGGTGRTRSGSKGPVPIKRTADDARPDGAQPPRSSGRVPRGRLDPDRVRPGPVRGAAS
jgi:Fe2+ transport system protein FeoA